MTKTSSPIIAIVADVPENISKFFWKKKLRGSKRWHPSLSCVHVSWNGEGEEELLHEQVIKTLKKLKEDQSKSYQILSYADFEIMQASIEGFHQPVPYNFLHFIGRKRVKECIISRPLRSYDYTHKCKVKEKKLGPNQELFVLAFSKRKRKRKKQKKRKSPR